MQLWKTNHRLLVLFWEGGGGNSCILAVLSHYQKKKMSRAFPWASAPGHAVTFCDVWQAGLWRVRSCHVGQRMSCSFMYVFSSNAALQVSLGLRFSVVHTISEVVAAQFKCAIWCSWVSLYATCFALLLAEVLGSLSWKRKDPFWLNWSDMVVPTWLPGKLALETCFF